MRVEDDVVAVIRADRKVGCAIAVLLTNLTIIFITCYRSCSTLTEEVDDIMASVFGTGDDQSSGSSDEEVYSEEEMDTS